MLVTNASNHDVDLDSGRVLAPLERADIDHTPRQDLMLDDGLLVLADDPEPLPDADQRGRTTFAPQTAPHDDVEPDDGPDDDDPPAAAPVPETPPFTAPTPNPTPAPAGPALAVSTVAIPAAPSASNAQES